MNRGKWDGEKCNKTKNIQVNWFQKEEINYFFSSPRSYGRKNITELKDIKHYMDYNSQADGNYVLCVYVQQLIAHSSTTQSGMNTACPNHTSYKFIIYNFKIKVQTAPSCCDLVSF